MRHFSRSAFALPLVAALALSVLPVSVRAQETPADKSGDAFEDLAKQAGKNQGVEKKAPKQTMAPLPWDAKPAAGFPPAEKIATQAQLEAELQRMRAKYAPFMAELAPAIPARRTLELENFDYRLASGEDAADPAGAAQGKGAWTKVKIPHYWGPQGPATAYYRCEVNLDTEMLSQDTLFLRFNGADYHAEVFVNGAPVGSHTGFFDAFEFDIKPRVKPGKNVILVRLRNEYIPFAYANSAKGHSGMKIGALGSPGWDEPNEGWTCAPAGFGLSQRARLEARPSAHVNDIFVRPLAGEKEAAVWVEVAQPAGGAPVTLQYSLYGQNFEAVVAENQTAPGESPKEISPGVSLHKFTLAVPPAQLRRWTTDEPWLYQLQVRLLRDGKVIDAAKKQFGLRTFVQSKTSTPKGRYYLNGSEVRLRGSNTMGNFALAVMEKDFARLRDDILIGKIAHLNFWRLTQQPCQEEVYDAFDKLGVLVQTDLPNFGSVYKEMLPEERRQAVAAARLVRGHPSNALISYMNEPEPGRLLLKEPKLDGPGMVAMFKDFDTRIAAVNPDQVTKWIDGDFMNLSRATSDHHWYTLWYKGAGIRMASAYTGAWMRTNPGWMHGCGEYGAEGLNTVAFMKKHFPAEWLKESADGKWDPTQVPMSQIIRVGKKNWYGEPGKGAMQDWVDASREHQKWANRLQTETMRRDARLNSYAQFLLIDARPNGWPKSVVDFDRQAKPAYFAFRDANAPLAVNLRPSRFYAYSGDAFHCGVWLCNDTHQTHPGATLRYQVELDGKVVSTGSTPAKLVACEPKCQGFLIFDAPATGQRRPMTVRVALFDKEGRPLHESSCEIDLIPASQKKEKIPARGGVPERLRAS